MVSCVGWLRSQPTQETSEAPKALRSQQRGSPARKLLPGVGDCHTLRCVVSVGQAVDVFDGAEGVVVVDGLAVLTGLDMCSYEDCGDVVCVGAVVFVPGQDEQAVMRFRPLDVVVQVVFEPGVGCGNRPIVHVVLQVGDDEGDC